VIVVEAAALPLLFVATSVEVVVVQD